MPSSQYVVKPGDSSYTCLEGFGTYSKDIAGQKVGRLTAVRPTDKRTGSGSIIWVMQCECGREIERSAAEFHKAAINNRTASCPNCRTKLLGEEAARNSLISQYKYGAGKRGLEWRLTEFHLSRLFVSSCHYCGCPPSNIVQRYDREASFLYQGIDRIDSELDYVPFNCVPCCKQCNTFKSVKSYEEFTRYLRTVQAYRGQYA